MEDLEEPVWGYEEVVETQEAEKKDKEKEKKVAGKRHYWALVCGDDIYGPFPSEKEVKYYHLVVHMAGSVKCSQGKIAKLHVAGEMKK